MRKYLILIGLLIAVFACEKSVTNEGFNFDGELQIKHGEIIQSDNNKISLEITNINDSRCPSDVVCVWEGEARITLEFANSITSTFELSTHDLRIDTIDNYIFNLIEVNPYPISTEILELKDYRIKLEIEEL